MDFIAVLQALVLAIQAHTQATQEQTEGVRKLMSTVAELTSVVGELTNNVQSLVTAAQKVIAELEAARQGGLNPLDQAAFDQAVTDLKAASGALAGEVGQLESA
jgi:hypothetical protein